MQLLTKKGKKKTLGRKGKKKKGQAREEKRYPEQKAFASRSEGLFRKFFLGGKSDLELKKKAKKVGGKGVRCRWKKRAAKVEGKQRRGGIKLLEEKQHKRGKKKKREDQQKKKFPIK